MPPMHHPYEDRWEFNTDRRPVPGEFVDVTQSLPWKWNCFLAVSWEFDDGNDWQVENIYTADYPCFVNPVIASALFVLPEMWPSMPGVIIQRRMPVRICATPQKHGLRFRCVVRGIAYPATLTDGVVSDVITKKPTP